MLMRGFSKSINFIFDFYNKGVSFMCRVQYLLMS